MGERDDDQQELVQGTSFEDAYVLTLGHGEVSVLHAYEPPVADEPGRHMLWLEPGLGVGEINAPVPDRPDGARLYPVAGAVVLVFEHPDAVQVVIDHLLSVKRGLVEGVESVHGPISTWALATP